MREDKHVEVVEAKDCTFIEATVINKKPHEPRATYDSANAAASIKKIREQNRLTLYARRANALIAIYCVFTGMITHMMPSLDLMKNWHDSVESQYQSSGFESLTQIPGPAMHWFAKVDITNGFQSILLPEAMRRFFTTLVYDPIANRSIHYRWRTWPQGYLYSSMAFRNAITHVLEKVTSHPVVSPHIASRELAFGNLKKDVGKMLNVGKMLI